MRALIVEPETTLRQSLALYLSQCRHYQVASTHSGKDARTLLAQEHFDLVLCAATLPDGDGLVLLEEWQATLRPSVVVLMAIRKDPSLRNRMERMGFTGCLVKPFDVQELESMLDRCRPA